jgi:hypothetical protein
MIDTAPVQGFLTQRGPIQLSREGGRKGSTPHILMRNHIPLPVRKPHLSANPKSIFVCCTGIHCYLFFMHQFAFSPPSTCISHLYVPFSIFRNEFFLFLSYFFLPVFHISPLNYTGWYLISSGMYFQ